MQLTGAIVTLKNFHLVGKFIEGEPLNVVLYVQDFEVYGSEGEPTFGNPTDVSQSRKVVAKTQQSVYQCMRILVFRQNLC